MTAPTAFRLPLLAAAVATLLVLGSQAHAGDVIVSAGTVIHRPATRTVVVSSPAEACVVVPRRVVVVRRPAVRYVRRYTPVYRHVRRHRRYHYYPRPVRYVRTCPRPRIGLSVDVVLP